MTTIKSKNQLESSIMRRIYFIWFSKRVLPLFSRRLDAWIARNRLNDWYEDAVVGMIKKGAKVFPVSTESYLWHEIDTPSDYQFARRGLRLFENEDKRI